MLVLGQMSTSRSIWDVWVKALILAKEGHATEVDVVHLRTALDEPPIDAPSVKGEGPFRPAPHMWMAFSPEAATLIATLGGIEQVTVESLGTALQGA